MRSLQLQGALGAYIEAAASHLQAELAAGAEVAFELGSRLGRNGGRGTPLYCYRALTGQFIAERDAALKRLTEHADAAKLLDGFDGLDRYLVRAGADVARARGRARAHLALRALLEDVFDEQTDFHVHAERVRTALERLEHAAIAAPDQLTLIATLHGIAISAPELKLAKGLAIAHPEAIEGVPDAARAPVARGRSDSHLLVIYGEEEDDPSAGLPRAHAIVGELLRALRLFGDGRVCLGAIGWLRVGTLAWSPVAVAGGGRPHGKLVITAEQEQELRAFCELVSRRAPRRDEIAWALRRFELGCDRDSAQEAFTDYLLALRALLEPEGLASALLAGRLAALCAKPEGRPELAERVAQAIALERAIVAGETVKQATVRALGEELCGHLRALLRDVICGHLDSDLASLADELLLAPAEEEPEPASRGRAGKRAAQASETDTGEDAANAAETTAEAETTAAGEDASAEEADDGGGDDSATVGVPALTAS